MESHRGAASWLLPFEHVFVHLPLIAPRKERIARVQRRPAPKIFELFSPKLQDPSLEIAMPTPLPVGEASGQVFIHALALVAGLLGLVGLVPTTIRLDYDTSSTLAMAYVAVRLSFAGCLSCLNYFPANIASPGMLGHRCQRLGDRCVGAWYEK